MNSMNLILKKKYFSRPESLNQLINFQYHLAVGFYGRFAICKKQT